MAKTQITIQNLIDRNKGATKDKAVKNFWSKLTSAYLNLNHVMASKIVKAVQTDDTSRQFDNNDYATDFAQLLVKKRVSISALVSVMRVSEQNKLSFSGKYFYKFLETLHEGYVKAPGFFTEEIMARMAAIKALPFVGHNELSDGEKKYIQDPTTPLELVDMLIQKPADKSFGEYPAFVESAVQDINTGRKTEVILLGLKNLMNYENIYTDKVVVEQGGLQNAYQAQNPAEGKITAKTQDTCESAIKGWINNRDDNQRTDLAEKLFKSLKGSLLIGTGYEKSVVEYVAKVQEADRDKAIAYSIYEARKTVKGEIQIAANDLRKSLLGVGQIDLIKTDGIKFKKDEQEITIRKFLKKAANSSRLQRAAKRYVMNALKKESAAIVAGEKNLQAMAAMLGSMDQETFTLIGAVMSQTMSEIQSEHNLNPEFWAGTMSRGWNKFTSYPAAVFFAIIDFFAIVFEYIGEYVTRGAFWAYEGVRDLVDKSVAEKRENQDIFKQADVENAMGALVQYIKDVDVDTKKVKSTAKEELRDAILNFFNDDNNSGTLKEKLTAFSQEYKNEESELETAIGKLTTQTDLTQHKKDLQAILDMPEMNQNISNALPSWSNAAKSVAILKSIG